MNEPGIWIALAALIVGCYFAACSIALRTFSRAKLVDLLEETGRRDRFEPLVDDVAELVLMSSTIRSFLNMVALLCVVAVARKWSENDFVVYGVTFAATAVLISIFSVAVPSSWARYHPEKLVVRSIPVLRMCLFFFTPLIHLLRLLDPVVRRITGGEKETEPDLEEDVMNVVEEHEEDGDVDKVQKAMIEAVFEFPTTTAGEIMTPRTEVHGIEFDSSLEDVKKLILAERHSRIPVFEETIDKIIGVLYAKDLINFLTNDEAFDLRSVMREPMMVPESKQVEDLLAEFKAGKIHIAIVLDEYGGTAGIITIEDILEELVGEIEDEYEQEEERPSIRRNEDNTADVDGRIEIDDFNDELGLKIPDNGEYETVAGFVFSSLGHIPKVGESVEIERARLVVTSADRNRINQLRVEFDDTLTGNVNGNGRNGH